MAEVSTCISLLGALCSGDPGWTEARGQARGPERSLLLQSRWAQHRRPPAPGFLEPRRAAEEHCGSADGRAAASAAPCAGGLWPRPPFPSKELVASVSSVAALRAEGEPLVTIPTEAARTSLSRCVQKLLPPPRRPSSRGSPGLSIASAPLLGINPGELEAYVHGQVPWSPKPGENCDGLKGERGVRRGRTGMSCYSHSTGGVKMPCPSGPSRPDTV